MDILTNPFVVGLLIGLVAAGAVAINSWSASRALKNEIKSLKEHLHTQMTINTRGNQDVTNEANKLRKENENLRVSLAALQNKPDRTELRTLYVYDRAVRLMYQRSPGFAPAWEAMVEEAESEVQEINSGVLAWVRKAIRPAPTARLRAAEDEVEPEAEESQPAESQRS